MDIVFISLFTLFRRSEKLKAILTTYICVAILNPTTAGRATVDLTLKQRKFKVTGNGPYKAVLSQSGIMRIKYLSALKWSIARTIGQWGLKKANRKARFQRCCEFIKNLLRTAYVSTSSRANISADKIRHNKQQQNHFTRKSGITSLLSAEQTYNSNLHTFVEITRTAQGGQKVADRRTHKVDIYVINDPTLQNKNRKSGSLLVSQSRNKSGNKGVIKESQFAQVRSKGDLNISSTHIKESRVLFDFSQREINTFKPARQISWCIPAGHNHKKSVLVSGEQIVELPNRSPHKKVQRATVGQKSRQAEFRSEPFDCLTGTRNYFAQISSEQIVLPNRRPYKKVRRATLRLKSRQAIFRSKPFDCLTGTRTYFAQTLIEQIVELPIPHKKYNERQWVKKVGRQYL